MSDNTKETGMKNVENIYLIVWFLITRKERNKKTTLCFFRVFEKLQNFMSPSKIFEIIITKCSMCSCGNASDLVTHR